MIVQPGFVDHWKTRMLVEALDGDELAPVYLLRLWEHCQLTRKWVFENLSPVSLKALCRYSGHGNKLMSGLLASGFVRQGSCGVLIVHDWDDHNAQLIAAWANGKKGGRPPTAAENPTVTHGLPDGNPTGTQPSICITPNPNSSSPKKIPTLEEVREYCAERARMGKVRVDPEAFFDFYEANGWVQGARGKPIKDWRACVRTWEKNGFRQQQGPHKPLDMAAKLKAQREANQQ